MNGIVAAFTGRIGGDGDERYTAGGTPFVSFSVAVADAKAAEGAPTEWCRVTLFGDAAPDLAPRIVKGTEVYCEGRLKLNAWTAADGAERTGLNLTAWTVQPLGQIGRRVPSEARRRPRVAARA